MGQLLAGPSRFLRPAKWKSFPNRASLPVSLLRTGRHKSVKETYSEPWAPLRRFSVVYRRQRSRLVWLQCAKWSVCLGNHQPHYGPRGLCSHDPIAYTADSGAGLSGYNVQNGQYAWATTTPITGQAANVPSAWATP